MKAKNFIKLAKAIPSDHWFDPIFDGDGNPLARLEFRNNESITFQFGNYTVYTLSEVLACLKDALDAELENVDCLIHVESENDGCWFDVQKH